MRVPFAVLCLGLGFLSIGSASAQPNKTPSVPTLAELREFAQKEIEGDVVVRKPSLTKKGPILASVDFGRLAETSPPYVAAQIRIELLRKYPIFGKQETDLILNKLENEVATTLKERRSVQKFDAKDPDFRQFDDFGGGAFGGAFSEYTRPLVLDYCTRNKLMPPLDIIAEMPSKYFVNGKFINALDVSFGQIQKIVADYFDNDGVSYTAPSKSQGWDVTRATKTVTYHPGLIPDLLFADPAIEIIWYWELLKRFPNVDKQILKAQGPGIDKNVKELFTRQQTLRRNGEGLGDIRLVDVFAHLYEADAKAANLLYQPGTQGPKVVTGLDEKIIRIQTDPKIKRVLVAPALAYRLAAHRKVDVSPLDLRVVANGDSREWPVGTYVYWFENINAGNKMPNSFNIPKDCDATGLLTLR